MQIVYPRRREHQLVSWRCSLYAGGKDSLGVLFIVSAESTHQLKVCASVICERTGKEATAKWGRSQDDSSCARDPARCPGHPIASALEHSHRAAQAGADVSHTRTRARLRDEAEVSVVLAVDVGRRAADCAGPQPAGARASESRRRASSSIRRLWKTLKRMGLTAHALGTDLAPVSASHAHRARSFIVYEVTHRRASRSTRRVAFRERVCWWSRSPI